MDWWWLMNGHPMPFISRSNLCMSRGETTPAFTLRPRRTRSGAGTRARTQRPNSWSKGANGYDTGAVWAAWAAWAAGDPILQWKVIKIIKVILVYSRYWWSSLKPMNAFESFDVVESSSNGTRFFLFYTTPTSDSQSHLHRGNRGRWCAHGASSLHPGDTLWDI